jgi:hypothetical protein
VTLLGKSKTRRKAGLHTKDRETKYTPLEKLTPMALEIDRRALTNSVCRDEDCQASFTSCYHAELIPLLRSRIQMGENPRR